MGFPDLVEQRAWHCYLLVGVWCLTQIV
jgi:hypothetical protein